MIELETITLFFKRSDNPIYPSFRFNFFFKRKNVLILISRSTNKLNISIPLIMALIVLCKTWLIKTLRLQLQIFHRHQFPSHNKMPRFKLIITRVYIFKVSKTLFPVLSSVILNLPNSVRRVRHLRKLALVLVLYTPREKDSNTYSHKQALRSAQRV